MATTTLRTACTGFDTLMQTLVSASTGGDAASIRKAQWGNGAPSSAPLPHLSYQVIRASRAASGPSEYMWKLQIKARIVFQVSGGLTSDAQDDMATYVALVSNAFDAWERPTGISGAENIEFTLVPPTNPTHGNMAITEGFINLNVRVSKGAN